MLFYLKRFSKFSAIERKLLFKGLYVYFISTFFIRFLPVRYYHSFFNTNNVCPEDANNDLVARELLTKTLLRLKKFIPLEIKCLQLSMITLKLSQMLGIYCRVKFAVNIEDKHKMFAHSYVTFGQDLYLFKNDRYIDIV